jgi:uncharacterized membrane protein HdeD (DUF308 family)
MGFINEAGWDRVVRVVLGLVLLGLYFFGVVAGTAGIVVLVVGALALLTGLVGFCPMYRLLNIRTNKAGAKKAAAR